MYYILPEGLKIESNEPVYYTMYIHAVARSVQYLLAVIYFGFNFILF